MQTTMIIALAILLYWPHPLNAASLRNDKTATEQEDSGMTIIRIMFNDQEVLVRMLDNAASRDFLALLPITVQFRDFAQSEKIAELPKKLQTHGSPTAQEAAGDFTYYAPWGNLAVFYKGLGSDSQLYVLGRIESGKETLGAMKRAFTAQIEKVH